MAKKKVIKNKLTPPLIQKKYQIVKGSGKINGIPLWVNVLTGGKIESM